MYTPGIEATVITCESGMAKDSRTSAGLLALMT